MKSGKSGKHPKKPQIKGPAQLDLGFARSREPDRNFEKGGRSFYFFDLDDNVLHLPTSIFLYHRDTREQRAVTTAEFARISGLLGKPGPFECFSLVLDDRIGSFRQFRDHELPYQGALQPFVEDVERALTLPDYHWKGPSWECFEYAVLNERPVALITARGHHPDTIREGISRLVHANFLSREPNYVEIFPVSRPETRLALGDSQCRCSTAELKKQAIIRCVEKAMVLYGENPYHRFGMSDDDVHNLAMITEAERMLKARYPKNSFYVIHADKRPFTKEEVFCDHTQPVSFDSFAQLDLELK